MLPKDGWMEGGIVLFGNLSDSIINNSNHNNKNIPLQRAGPIIAAAVPLPCIAYVPKSNKMIDNLVIDILKNMRSIIL